MLDGRNSDEKPQTRFFDFFDLFLFFIPSNHTWTSISERTVRLECRLTSIWGVNTHIALGGAEQDDPCSLVAAVHKVGKYYGDEPHWR